MDNTKTAKPDSSNQTAAAFTPDDAPGVSRNPGGPERSTSAGEVLQRYLKAQATQISRIVASLNQYRQDVQKLELSLIARIGDVDDDRRHAATRLQRTLQTQRDELDARLKRHGSLMAMLLLLFSLLVAGTLVFFLVKINATQDALETRMSDLHKTLEQLDASAKSAPDPETRAQLDRLSAALAEISKSIERLNEEAVAAPLDLDLNLQPVPRPEAASEPGPHPPMPLAMPSASEPEPEPEAQTEPAEPQPSTPAVAPSEPTPVGTPAADSATDVEQTAEAPALEDAAASPVAQQAAPDAAEPSPINEPTPESGPSIRDQAVMAPESTPVPETAVQTDAPDAARNTGSLSPALATNPIKVGDHRPFTIQLIGFHSLDALERFAADQVLPVVYYYRQETYQGRPWFVLIHSLHETREAAEAVVVKLPPGLANLNIWIRRLKADTDLVEVRRLGS